jgi:twinkle protein
MGITDLLIDRWNELEHSRGGATETDDTGRSLQKLKGFAFRRGCNVWIVAHPTKMRPPAAGENILPPGPYDISGSSNWANKADVGLTIHNPDNKATAVIVWKSRFARWGRKGEAAELEFDTTNGRYQSPMEVQIKYGPDAWNDMRRKEDQTQSEDFPQ